MIVRRIPSFRHLFFIKQGSIVPQILPIIIGILLFSLLVIVVDRYLFRLVHLSFTPMSVFGIALSLFLGFRNNAAYNRWWEARMLWGQLIADCRSLVREVQLFVDDNKTQQDL
ncbi:MAG: bestrophin family ion channel, partial [Parachlamydiaceae bacterium]